MSYADSYVGVNYAAVRTFARNSVISLASAKTHSGRASKCVRNQKRFVDTHMKRLVMLPQHARKTSLVRLRSSSPATVSAGRRRSGVMHGLFHCIPRE
jgi:hypothetical protein